MERSMRMVQHLDDVKYRSFSRCSIQRAIRDLKVNQPCFCSRPLQIRGSNVNGPWESCEIDPLDKSRPKRVLPAAMVRILKNVGSDLCMLNVLEDGDCGAHALSVVYRVIASHSFYSHLPPGFPTPDMIRELIVGFVAADYPTLNIHEYHANIMDDRNLVRYLETPEIQLWCEKLRLNCGVWGFSAALGRSHDYVLNIHAPNRANPWVFFVVTKRGNHYEIMARVAANRDICITFSSEEAQDIVEAARTHSPCKLLEVSPRSYFENFPAFVEDLLWDEKPEPSRTQKRPQSKR